ncbi:GAF domain-containing protein [Pleurocapsales cyanobacterium LEGE 06147]|nr:GAF domain-containing protein [Pleurocapsales cyanobacterium LEGE 06147]
MSKDKEIDRSEVVTARAIELNNYDEEPIHAPDSIQPHGMVFALEEPQLKIILVSNNSLEFLGLHPRELLSKKLKDLFGSEQIKAIETYLAEDFDSISPRKISLHIHNKKAIFDGIIHRSNGIVILELEPTQSSEEGSFFRFHDLVKGSMNKMQNASNLSELCQVVVQEIRKISGFDRVMAYRFDSEGVGKVIAEERSDKLISYLGLHFPAIDLPKEARRLFTLNWLRFIPDVNAQPVELVSTPNSVISQPLDLSFSVLRSVSPCHVEYLNNMGVAASMSISLIKEKKLWGLIACHHSSPKYVSYEMRTACEFLGQAMSLELAAKEENEDIDYKMKLTSIQAKLVEAIAHTNNFAEGLVQNPSNLLDLVGARGAAVYLDGNLALIGQTPQETEIQELVNWIATHSSAETFSHSTSEQVPVQNDIVFQTDSLPQIYPAAEQFKDVASGVLALTIAKLHKNYLLWFRPEIIQTVKWGGNPDQPVGVKREDSLHLSPRKSFELWQETVRLKSLPWKQWEIKAALELRNSIAGMALRKADELSKINAELERSNAELDAFTYIASHDLKEPLRGIHNYSSFLLEDYAEVLDEDGIAKLKTLVQLTQRMENLIESLLYYSRLGRAELLLQPVDLDDLVKNHVLDVLAITQHESGVDIRIPRPLPTINCDRILVRELFSNLISNAIKYNDKSEKWVEIGFLDEESPTSLMSKEERRSQPCLIFYVKDNGIGIRQKHQESIFRIFKRLHPRNKYGGGTGAGLTIAKKIVERHDGKIWVKSTYGKGSTFYFTLSS